MTGEDRDELLAQMAQLDRLWDRFPEDVRIAIAQARLIAARLPRPTDPMQEPWPPMRVGGGA